MRCFGFLVLLTASGLLACASGTARQEAEPQPSTAALEPDGETPTEQTAEPAAAGDSDTAPEAADAAADDSYFYLPDSEPAAVPPPTLVEAAAAARAQRAAAGPPVVTLTDENLTEFAAGGSLTFADAPEPPEADLAAGGSPDEDDTVASMDPASGEEYWRSALREVRLRWRDAVQRIEDLNGQVAGLRRAFYAEDDPVYRDREIKPAWDLALADLAAAKAEVRAAREELQQLLEAGRRAGALPGWLREGIELEPQPKERSSDLPDVELREPEVVGESRP